MKAAIQVNQEKAAERFLATLFGAERRQDGSQSVVEKLVYGAYTLYAIEWGANFDIRQWEWPINELNNVSGFSGKEPWTVLFAEAVSLASIDLKKASAAK